MDSNIVERSIRRIALNRKNAPFAGSDGGGEHWAVLAWLIETCKLNGVDPQGYLADVISRIVQGHPNSRRGASAACPGHEQGPLTIRRCEGLLGTVAYSQ